MPDARSLPSMNTVTDPVPALVTSSTTKTPAAPVAFVWSGPTTVAVDATAGARCST
jgi:hypothetical protein